jgi:hypothetical protein
MIYLNAQWRRCALLLCMSETIHSMWETIRSAPLDRAIELAVIDEDGIHALVFPCRRSADGWVKAASGERLDVRPTHWREWRDGGGRS